jgi:pimeloyl-ACP methyl ester carboxylesterase
MPRTRWRGLTRKGLLLCLGLCAVSALIEHVLELRDAARLTASDTFYATRGRRIRYHLTGANVPGPTVVLLNGSSASLEQWSKVQAALSAVAPVVSYDRGGAGFSDSANAHDANAEADELDQLLHCPEIAGPFVLVSFSSSSPMATVFAATHLDVVKGIVFVDPILSSPPGTKSWRRILWRPSLANPLAAFFGYTRLKRAILDRYAPPSSPESERWNAVIVSTHHWIAGALESMSLDKSGDEANAALATRPFAVLPLGVLTTADPAESEYLRKIFDRQKNLVASSNRSIMRVIHGVHSQLLNDPVARGSIVDLIRTIVDDVRGNAAVGFNGDQNGLTPQIPGRLVECRNDRLKRGRRLRFA